MKKFNDYNIAPIKCETKVGGTSVKEGLYKVNGVLYPHKFDYICPALLKRTRAELRVALIKLFNTNVPPIAQKKKDEILQKGKSYFQKMKELELLKENQQVYDDYYTDASQYIDLYEVSTDTFRSMQKELESFVRSSLGLKAAS